MRDRKVIDNETLVAAYKGRVWTGAEMIEQANGWVCSVTALGFRKFLRFETGKQSGHTYRFIVAELPSGEEYTATVGHWLHGCRPSAFTMDSHIIKKAGEAYGRFLGWGKQGKGRTMKLLLPSGEVYEVQVDHWRAGQRPTQFTTERHLYMQQAEDEGYRFIEWSKTKNSMPTMKLLLPSGEIYECQVTNWRAGCRPDGRIGGYNETYFDRNPEACNDPALIYYLKFSHPIQEPFYKVGITRRDSTAHRFGKKAGDYTVTVLNTHQMSLYNCFMLEQDLLKTFARHRHTPNPPLVNGGDTECFSIDILGLDPESEEYEWRQAAQ